MSAMRYSGAIQIRVTYLDWQGETYSDGTFQCRNGKYRCFLRCGDKRCTIYVGAPESLSHPVDSPEAFDDAASAAIAFAEDEERGEWAESAGYDLEGKGFHVGRSLANAWPKAPPRSGPDFVNDRGE